MTHSQGRKSISNLPRNQTESMTEIKPSIDAVENQLKNNERNATSAIVGNDDAR